MIQQDCPFCVNAAVINAWLLYRNHLKQDGETKTTFMQLKNFQCSIGHALTTAGKCGKKRRDQPSLEASCSKIKQKEAIQPIDDICFDNIGHWPAHSEKKL